MQLAADEISSYKWYPNWRLCHTYVASAISLAVSVASSIGKMVDSPISMNTEMVLLVGCVAILGIPHGASDHVVIANSLYKRFRTCWLPVFLVVYLGLVGLVLFFWHLAPVLALITFIAVSALHFGLGDVDRKLAQRDDIYLLEVCSRGFMIMVLPCVHHTKNVDRIWSWLVGDEDSNRSVILALEWMHHFMPFWYISICAIVVWHQILFFRCCKLDRSLKGLTTRSENRNSRDSTNNKTQDVAESDRDNQPVNGNTSTSPNQENSPVQTTDNLSDLSISNKVISETHIHSQQQVSWLEELSSPSCHHHSIIVELFSIYALFASTSPLVAFIIYFCIWHSARHNFMVAAACFDKTNAFKALSSFFWASVPFSLGALGMGYAGFHFMHDKPENLIKVQLRMVFIGLNALTIPHMMFIELSDLRGRVASGQCANFIGMVMGTTPIDSSKKLQQKQSIKKGQRSPRGSSPP